MSDGIHPHGEDLRNALRWLSGRGDHSPRAIGEAAVKFDLSPLDTEFLLKLFAREDADESSQEKG